MTGEMEVMALTVPTAAVVFDSVAEVLYATALETACAVPTEAVGRMEPPEARVRAACASSAL